MKEYVERHQEVFWTFMDLEKAFDRIDTEVLWQVLRVLRGIQSFYVGSKACVKVGSERFEVNVPVKATVPEIRLVY